MSWVAVNPATGEMIGEYPLMSPSDVEAILGGAATAQTDWRRSAMERRSEAMGRAARVLEANKERYARTITQEMGKPIGEARSEIDKCAWVCRYYADHASGQLAPEPMGLPGEEGDTFVSFQPLGVVLAIMPWNFPFWQAFRFAAPNLMAGNGGILKHAPNVPGCALAVQEVFREAGFPVDLFRSVIVDLDLTRTLIRDRRIAAVTLTGSVEAGRAVAAEAGRRVKKTVLELGGSDPYLILEDADLDVAVEACVTSRLLNSGQSCIAAKRFVVVAGRRKEFEEGMVERMAKVTMGDPMDERTELGPQARPDLRDSLQEQVEASLRAGARLLLGGHPAPPPGFFYPPTVLTDVGPGMPAYDEELFGPVASIITVQDEDEAIQVANDSVYGLGAAVFTRDRERGRRIAEQELEAGCCFVNGFVRSDPRLPFGGVKESGYGRELAAFGIREFVNIKTVRVP